MKTELQEELFAIAPEWFNRTDLRMSLMAFGFECGDGWFKLLKNGMEWIHKELNDKYTYPDGPPPFQVQQVKEKFGTLRFYVYGGNQRVANIISAMETASGLICEGCGAAGELTDDGNWYRTECWECTAVRRNRHGWK